MRDLPLLVRTGSAHQNELRTSNSEDCSFHYKRILRGCDNTEKGFSKGYWNSTNNLGIASHLYSLRSAAI